MSAIAMKLDIAQSPNAPVAEQRKALRSACQEFVSMGMFGQMLRDSRSSKLNGSLFHSPSERIFAGQLDDVLLQRSSGGIGGGLAESMYRQLAEGTGLESRPTGKATGRGNETRLNTQA